MIKEYTLLSLCALCLTIWIDRRFNVHLLRRPRFYLFLLIILFFKILVNGYLTSKKIVNYNPEFFLNFRIGSIPLEDFFFGFSMVSLSIIFWEKLKKKDNE